MANRSFERHYSLFATPYSLPLGHLRQEHCEQSDRRQEGADLVDELDRGVVGELTKRGGAQPSDAEGDAEEHSEIMPKRCGTSSCANTMIVDVVEERTRPMTTVSAAPA